MFGNDVLYKNSRAQTLAGIPIAVSCLKYRLTLILESQEGSKANICVRVSQVLRFSLISHRFNGFFRLILESSYRKLTINYSESFPIWVHCITTWDEILPYIGKPILEPQWDDTELCTGQKAHYLTPSFKISFYVSA